VSPPARRLLALLAVVALGVAAWALPAVRWERRIPLASEQLIPAAGHAWRYEVALPATADKPHEVRSSVRLLEDGRPLGPAHREPEAIAAEGGGAFLHQKDAILLSSSDGSDPSANGRRYEALVPARLPRWLIAGVGLAFLVLVFAVPGQLASAGSGPAGRRALLVAATQGVAALVALETLSRAVTLELLAEDGATAQAIYDRAFGRGGDAGAAPAYVPRAYTIYALNPERTADGARAVDPEFLVRRAEPLRPRGEVGLRILAVGGSTTQDEKIRSERLTWVHQLESLLRERIGPDVEVINGGAGGYTIYENFIQYVTLLTYLEPDVVLFFQGINDVHPRLLRNARYDYGDYNRPWWDASAWLEAERSPLRVSWTWRLGSYALRYARLRQAGIQGLTRRDYPPPEQWAAALAATSPALFGSIYENFVTLVQAQGRRAVLLPQLWVPRNPSDEVFGTGVAQHNQVAAAVAAARGADFVPLERLETGLGADDFADNCHFRPSGARKMAAAVAAFLEERGLLARRAR
jgi:lysophospholipase L1-like esterase